MKVEEAEEIFVGGCLAFPDRIMPLIPLLQPEDIYSPLCRDVWRAIQYLHAEGMVPDEVTVADAAKREKSDVLILKLNALPPMPEHAAIIRREALKRRASLLATEFVKRVREPDAEPEQLIADLFTSLNLREHSMLTRPPEHRHMHDVVDETNATAPWVIPGLIRRDWRCMFVGSEGKGKSVLLRQICMLAAQGIHPLWQSKRIAPVRTLVADLENPVAAVAETGRRMRNRLETMDGYDLTRCDIWMKPGGVDLRTPAGAGALEREIHSFRPDLVALGPLYKATSRQGRESYEEMAGGVQRVLDSLRTRYGFALLLEAHAPHGETGRKREMRPEQSSWWLRWPELGIGVEKDLTLSRWRGDRLTTSWPDSLARSAEWPFVGEWKESFPNEEEEMF